MTTPNDLPELPPFPEIPLTPEQRLRWAAWGEECFEAGMRNAASLERENEVLCMERDMARTRVDTLIKTLTGIHLLLSPEDVESNGKVYRFTNPMANETLRELSARIKAIPDAIRASIGNNESGQQE